MKHRLLSLFFLLHFTTPAMALTQDKATKIVVNDITFYVPGKWQHAFDNPEHGHHAYRDTANGLELVIAVHDANIMKFYSDTLTNYQLALNAYENDIDHWVDEVEPQQALENTNANYIIRGLNNPEENSVILYGAKNGKIIGLSLMKTTDENIDADYARNLLYKVFSGSK